MHEKNHDKLFALHALMRRVLDMANQILKNELSRFSPEYAETTLIANFARHVDAIYSAGTNGDYEKLHSWSVLNIERFWIEVWDFLSLTGSKGIAPFLSIPDGDMLKAEFFPTGQLNYARNLLDHDAEGDAIVFCCEGKGTIFSWKDLRDMVSRVAQALEAGGLCKGDRVCAVVSNCPETVAVMLAVTSLGGVWSSVSPDFGAVGILERFSQIEPKWFFATSGYFNKGEYVDCSETINHVSLVLKLRVVVIPFTGRTEPSSFSEFIAPFQPKELKYAATRFNDPLFIMFSSGTTGKPKCIIHRHGGVLIQIVKEHRLHCDIRPGDRVYYYTTCTWMMWHWLVTALASKATILLWEGNVFYPSPTATLEFSSRQSASFVGVSAKFIESLKPHAAAVAGINFQEKLRIVSSTGSPLSPEGFDFVYANFTGRNSNFLLTSICGGTDIVSCFMLGCPLKPVLRGRLQCRGLGMDVKVLDTDSGANLIGNKGELVCVSPFPSQPIGFFGDAGNSNYRAAYFSDPWPRIWRHGDFVEIASDGSMIVYGRSDATLKPGGVRIGTAEIYRAVEGVSFVKESICVGLDSLGDQVVALFVVLTDPSAKLTDADRAVIKKEVLRCCTRHHVPKVIEQVSEIPRTKNGKIVELAVRDVLHGREVKNLNSLQNPEALSQFSAFRNFQVSKSVLY